MTVYERADRVGGLLRYGIPTMKLGRNVLDRSVTFAYGGQRPRLDTAMILHSYANRIGKIIRVAQFLTLKFIFYISLYTKYMSLQVNLIGMKIQTIFLLTRCGL